MNNEKQLMFLYEILTLDKDSTKAMYGATEELEKLEAVTKRLLKSRASEYSFNIRNGYLFIKRL